MAVMLLLLCDSHHLENYLVIVLVGFLSCYCLTSRPRLPVHAAHSAVTDLRADDVAVPDESADFRAAGADAQAVRKNQPLSGRNN